MYCQGSYPQCGKICAAASSYQQAKGERVARRYHPQRFKELILYLLAIGEDDPTLGAVKLNKLLYYADRRAYLELGRSITGARYMHLEEGPAPNALVPARREMIEAGDVEANTRWYLSHPQERLTAKRKPDPTMFTKDELRVVHDVVRDLRDMNAADVTRLSHREWGWRLTSLGEEIPERTAWLSAEPLTVAQIEAGQRLWAEWLVARPEI